MTYKGKIYIPSPAVSNVLQALHEGYVGFDRCLLAAKQTIFWPSMAKDIKRQVEKCDLCAEFSNIKRMSALTLSPFEKSVAALRPMQNVQVDIFKLKAGTNFWW